MGQKQLFRGNLIHILLGICSISRVWFAFFVWTLGADKSLDLLAPMSLMLTNLSPRLSEGL